MFSLKEKIFTLYDEYDYLVDPNKDSDGKGTLERYNENLGQEFDDHFLPLILNLESNLLNPNSAPEKFLLYLEYHMGDLPPMGLTDALRRKFIKFAFKLYQIKGTLRAYEVMLRLLGFDTVAINDVAVASGFDESEGFDDESKVFDNSCPECTEYDIDLTGTITIDDQVIAYLINVINFNQPINCRLRSVFYNGDELVLFEGLNAPGDVTALVNDDFTNRVTWTDTNEDEFEEETGYAVQRSLSPNGPWIDVGQTGIDVTEIIDNIG